MSQVAHAVPAFSPEQSAAKIFASQTEPGLVELVTCCPICQGSISVFDEGYNRSCCNACGYVFENPRPTPEEVSEFYSKPQKYDSWLALERSRKNLWARRLRKLKDYCRPGSLLDVGSGIGEFLALARPYFDSVCGTEVSESGVRIAKVKYGLDVLQGRVEELDLGTRKFDNITLVHVLEHVHDPITTIEHCKKLLNDRGVLTICVPNDILAWRSRLRALGKRLGLKRFAKFSPETGLPRTGEDPEIHLSHFTPPVLIGLLQRCGFHVLSVSLDPYFADRGLRQFFNHLYYLFHRCLFTVCGYNAYDTLWIVCAK